jgi:hypothetical protein
VERSRVSCPKIVLSLHSVHIECLWFTHCCANLD